MSDSKRARSERAAKVTEDPLLTDDELALLARVRGSPLHKALSLAFTLLRNQEHPKLLDPSLDHPSTQFVRGRLTMLSDIVLLLEEEAPRRYDERRKAAEHKPSEPRT